MSDAIQIFQGDCLKLLPSLPDGCIDMVLADLPYGILKCEWDVRIPLEPLWGELWRVCKRNAAIVMFAQQPFATDLINSARRFFRYEWVWRKTKAVGFLNSKKMPLRLHELALVFYRFLPTYNPQMRQAKVIRKGPRNHFGASSLYGKQGSCEPWRENGLRYPVDVITMGRDCAESATAADVCRKPCNLLEMLVRTYTNEGETVLDPTMGSGSTGVACVRTGRRFVGMELDAGIFGGAERRIFAEAGKPRKTPSKAPMGSGAGQYAPGVAQAICKGFATGLRGDSGAVGGTARPGKEEMRS